MISASPICTLIFAIIHCLHGMYANAVAGIGMASPRFMISGMDELVNRVHHQRMNFLGDEGGRNHDIVSKVTSPDPLTIKNKRVCRVSISKLDVLLFIEFR